MTSAAKRLFFVRKISIFNILQTIITGFRQHPADPLNREQCFVFCQFSPKLTLRLHYISLKNWWWK